MIKTKEKTQAVSKYIYDSFSGREADSRMLGRDEYGPYIEKVVSNEKRLNEVSKELLGVISDISVFDVGLSNISEKLIYLSQELSKRSASNLEAVEETTASMNQVNEDVNHATEVLDNLSEESIKLVNKNNEGIRQLERVAEIKNEIIGDSQDMSERISYLIELVHGIEQMVESVGSIANRTNLLALNASIEAARAGEHGKGFAVVAEQVRELADGTKQQLKDMKDFVEKIYQASEEGQDSTKRMVSSTDSIGSEIDEVTKTVVGNIDMMKLVVEQIVDVNSKMQSINASAMEVNEAMESSSHDAEEIMRMTESVSGIANKSREYGTQIAGIDDRLSKCMKKIYLGLNDGIVMLSNEELIETLQKAKAAHISWMGKLKDMIDSTEEFPLQFDPNRCAFGHFYNAIEVNNKKLAAAWKEIGELHTKFHLLGKSVRDDIRDEKMSEAQRKFTEITELSQKMINKLQWSIDEINEMSKNGINVF